MIVGLIAALPVIASTARALIAHWTPTFDDALIATRAFDVLTAHSSLVGPFSDATLSSVGPLYSPGPLLFWLLAAPTHMLGDWALAVTMGAVNTAAILGVVALSCRRGGRGFMFATAVAVAIMCRSLPPEALHGLVNPRPALLPFTLMVFLVWSVLCGDYRLLPLTAFVVSFVAQTHFSMAWPVVGSVALMVLGLLLGFLRARRLGQDDARALKRWSLWALVVTLACWSAPLLDQALHTPGNLERIFQTLTAGRNTFGSAAGGHALVEAIGGRPWWLRFPGTAGQRLLDVLAGPSAWELVMSFVILAVLGAAVWLGFRRRRRDLLTGASLALVLAASIGVVAASTPTTLFLQLQKSMLWASPAGMFVWLVCGWSIVVLVRPARWRLGRSPGRFAQVRPAAGSIVPICMVGLCAFFVVLQMGGDDEGWLYQPVRQLLSRVQGRLPRKKVVLVSAQNSRFDFIMFSVQTAFTYQLRRAGYRVVVPSDVPNLIPKLGDYYSGAHHTAEEVLTIRYGRSGEGGRSLARVAVPRAGLEALPSHLGGKPTFNVSLQ